MTNRAIILILILLQIGCSKELENHEFGKSQFVFNCLLSPELPIQVNISETAPMSSLSYTIPNEITVVVTEGNSIIDTLKQTTNGWYVSKYKARHSTIYSFQVYKLGELVLTASDSTPISPPDLKFIFKNDIKSGPLGVLIDEVEVEFKDSLEKGDIYELLFYNKTQEGFEPSYFFEAQSDYFYINNDKLACPSNSLLLYDSDFNGTLIKISINLFVNETYIAFRKVSQSYYQYYKVLDKHLCNQNISRDDNIFELFKGEPVEAYSNINGGVGNCMSYTQKTYRIILTE